MSNRYVPDVVPSDGDDTRWALETAHTLFVQSEWREALQWVRRAAEAAAEAGQDARALELAKSVSELRTRIDIPRTLPPARAPDAIDAAPLVIPGPAAVPDVAHSMLAGSPKQPSFEDGRGLGTSAAGGLAGGSSPPTSLDTGRSAVPGRAAASAVSWIRSSPPDAAAAADRSAATRPDDELVVTVVSTDGTIPAKNAAFVSHRAVRVAILPAGDDDTHYLVRPLASGEVAPQDSTVGLLVSFESGASPLPRKD